MKKNLSLSLLFLRISVFVVMFFWTIDKLVRPEHAASVFEGFYLIPGVKVGLIKLLGAIELVLIVAFLFGIKKRLTYGMVLVLHAVSTLSSYKQYFAPFENGNLLFFAAWPMLAACTALYLLRDEDTMFVLGR